MAETPDSHRFRLRAPSPLEALLALAYGVVIGGWLPARPPEPVYLLPAIVVTTPEIPIEIAARRPPTLSPLTVDAAVITAAWFPDTLPAAPRFPVRPLAAGSAPSRAGIGIPAGAGPTRGAGAACPAIYPVGVEIPAHCRRAAPRASTSACPPARSGSGPVLCIRAED